MASFECDQAEGLRRLLVGSQPSAFTFLSAATMAEKSTMLVNLAASLSAHGRNVVMLDACVSEQGIARRMGVSLQASLLDVSRQHRTLEQALHQMPQGFHLASLVAGSRRALTASTTGSESTEQMRRLSNTFHLLMAQSDVLLVDAELDADGGLPLATMENGDIVIQVTPAASSIKDAYALIKRLHGQSAGRSFGILVTGAGEQEAETVFMNMERAASRYLGLRLFSFGFIPDDEQMTHAARLGRAVIDAFPRAGAAVAFRRLAARLAVTTAGTTQTGIRI